MSIYEVTRDAFHDKPIRARLIDDDIERANHHQGPRPTLRQVDDVNSFHTDIDDKYPYLTQQLVAYADEVQETETLSGHDYAGNPFEIVLFERVHHGAGINDIEFEADGYANNGRSEWTKFVYVKPGERVDVYVSPAARLKAAIKAALRRS